MAFNPDAFLAKTKQAFDPDAFLATSAPEGRSAEAALEGFGSAATAGYAPQIGALIGGLLPDPGAAQDQELRAKGFSVPEQPGYVERRDALIKRQQGLQEAAPGAYLGGQLGGAIASAPLATKALGLGGKGIGALMKAGAVEGAVQNPGDVEGEINPLQLQERAQGGLAGAATGGAVGAIAKPLEKAASALQPNSLKAFGARKAFKATGPILRDVKKAAARGRIEEIGETLIKKGIVKPGATFEDIADASDNLRGEAGKKISSIYESVHKELKNLDSTKLSADQVNKIQSTMPNAIRIAEELETGLTQELTGSPGGKKALAAASSLLDDLRANGKDTSILTLQSFKEDLDDLLKYNRAISEEPIQKQAIFKIRDAIKNKIQDHISALDGVVGSDKLKKLREANKEYGALAEASRIAKDRVGRESANRTMGLTDTIAGVGGGVGGAVTGGLLSGDVEGALKGAALGSGLGLLNKGARLYGNPAIAKGAYSLGSSLEGLPPGLLQAPQKGLGLLQTPEAGIAINRMRGQR